jgi:hypothetical protein
MLVNAPPRRFGDCEPNRSLGLKLPTPLTPATPQQSRFPRFRQNPAAARSATGRATVPAPTRAFVALAGAAVAMLGGGRVIRGAPTLRPFRVASAGSVFDRGARVARFGPRVGVSRAPAAHWLGTVNGSRHPLLPPPALDTLEPIPSTTLLSRLRRPRTGWARSSGVLLPAAQG